VKRPTFKFCYFTGITQCIAWWHRKRVMILCYHGITERPERDPNDPDGLHVRSDRFAAQLNYLQAHYHILSLSEYLAARRAGHPLPEYSLILTFDDGLRNFLTVAAPLLAERRVPAALFLVTGWMSESGGLHTSRKWSPADDEASLPWAEMQVLQQEYGVEIGSHTCTHQVLPDLPTKEAERELRDSRAAIVEHLKPQSDTLALAYPKGGYSAWIIERARALGYSCALTTDRGFNDASTDLFKLHRHIVGDEEVPVFAAHICGLVWWLHEARAFLQRRLAPQTQLVPKTA
jgi:peptidoglycan/xylan/chitin deacetylase (PgdA/CDA1 family)